MIEFAILAPVLILLVMGVIEIGRFMYFGIVAAHMAESGVRYGAQTLGTAADTTGMSNAAYGDGAGLGWQVAPTKSCSQAGSVVSCPNAAATPAPGTIYYVKVVVTATFHPLLNYPGIPSYIPVSSTAMLRVQNQ
jgi:Flp pilus assembly protein TadG